MTRRAERNEGIELWLSHFCAERDRERDDRHIDTFDARYRSASRWVAGASAVLSAARAIVTARQLRVSVAVEFFLTAGREPLATRPRSAASLLAFGLSWTPPALTAYVPGREPWRDASSFEPIPDLGREWGPDSRAFFQEWYDAAERNYDRRLWVVREWMA
jgi:hypothetical protein